MIAWKLSHEVILAYKNDNEFWLYLKISSFNWKFFLPKPRFSQLLNGSANSYLEVKCLRKARHIFPFFSHALLCVSMRFPSYLLSEFLFIFQNPSEMEILLRTFYKKYYTVYFMDMKFPFIFKDSFYFLHRSLAIC